MDYKSILFSAIGEQFENLNITGLQIMYNIKKNESVLFIIQKDKKEEKIKLTKSENKKIKILIFNKLEKLFRKSKEFKDKSLDFLILELSFSSETLKIYVEHKNELIDFSNILN